MEADLLTREGKRGIPSLDGLRAVSILLVLVAHTCGSVPGVKTLGSFGVRVFFVISGFLITTLLVAEIDRTGRIDLRRFYLRRTLRIFPPYYLLIGVVGMLVMFELIGPPNIRYWPAITYTSNYFSTRSWWLGHSWSLSVEEQFYLVWPLCMVSLGQASARSAAVAMLLAGPVLRCALLFTTSDGAIADNFNFDFIAAGCSLALFRRTLDSSPRWRNLMRSTLPPLCAAGGVALHIAFAEQYRWRAAIEMVVVQPVEALTIAAFIAWCVVNHGRSFGRVLNAPALRGIGIVSYSIYLWQQIVLGVIVTIPWYARIGCAIAIGVASYYLVERTALQLRKSIEGRIREAHTGLQLGA